MENREINKSQLIEKAKAYASYQDGGVTINDPDKYSIFRDGQESVLELLEQSCQSGERVEKLQEQVKNIRSELYDSLPSGELNAFDLIKLINTHMRKLDEIIYPAPNTVNKIVNTLP